MAARALDQIDMSSSRQHCQASAVVVDVWSRLEEMRACVLGVLYGEGDRSHTSEEVVSWWYRLEQLFVIPQQIWLCMAYVHEITLEPFSMHASIAMQRRWLCFYILKATVKGKLGS